MLLRGPLRACVFPTALFLATALGSGCEEPPSPRVDAADIPLRRDLGIQLHDASILEGRSETVLLHVPEGTASFLLEVKSEQGGFHFIDRFVTPRGVDLAGGGLLVTREAREVAGLVDFLYPNDDTLRPAPGTYEVSFRSFEDRAASTPMSEGTLEIRSYAVAEKPSETCGLRLDFLVDDDALAQPHTVDAIDDMAALFDEIYRRVGIELLDYQIQRVNLRSDTIDVGDQSVLAVADEVLQQARSEGGARQGAVHVLLVRSIAGESASGFDPSGYSLGLPGPFAADRPTSTVLLATGAFAHSDTSGALTLDVPSLATTLAHEVGHFLGLYHLSELGGREHDPLLETPECSDPWNCSEQFRQNVMASSSWLTAAQLPATGRLHLTPAQGAVLRRHPLCIPLGQDAGAADPAPDPAADE